MKYFYANGSIHPLEESEEGLTIPQWALQYSGDEGSDFRMLTDDENDEYTRQQDIKNLGFDMGAARWAGNEQAFVENPATGQMEMIVNTPQGPMLTSQAQTAGMTGTPLMKPAEEGSTLGQFMDLAKVIGPFAGMAGLSSLATNALAGGDFTASIADMFNPTNVASSTVEAGGLANGNASLGGLVGGGETGLTMEGAGGLATMGGAQGLVAPAGTSFAGATIPATVAGGQALGSFLGGNAANVAGSAGATTLANALGSGATTAATNALTQPAGQYQVPWDKVIGGLMEFGGQQNYADKLAEAMKYAVDKADPFAAERPFYQGQLRQMFTDPNYFNNQPLLQGANRNAINDTTRALASQGYNMSGNVPMEVAQRLQNNNMSFAQDLMNKTGGYAGAGFGPGQAGTVAGTLGPAQAKADMNSYGALGSIFQNVWNGQQPTAANQVQGQRPNQNLYSYLFS